jgi:hypothetical protein
MREIVRQLFALRRGTAPRVTATVLDEPDTAQSSLEVVNEGGQAVQVRCLIRSDAGTQEVTVGTLARDMSTVVDLHEPVGKNIECVWTGLDTRDRQHVWSYDGRHVRLRTGHEIALPAALEQMYHGARRPDPKQRSLD